MLAFRYKSNFSSLGIRRRNRQYKNAFLVTDLFIFHTLAFFLIIIFILNKTMQGHGR